jgi:phosphoketolase
MDIKIKYKEIDKVNMVRDLVQQVICEIRKNLPIGSTETARLIDTIYKSERKEIESVTIRKDDNGIVLTMDEMYKLCEKVMEVID